MSGSSKIKKNAYSKSYESEWRKYEELLKKRISEDSVKGIEPTPAIKSALMEAVERLLKAQIQVLEKDKKNPRILSSAAEIRIVQDSTPNARILILDAPLYRLQDLSEKGGHARIYNAVEFTTGLMDLLADKPEHFERVIGAIAHEIGHSTEYVSLTGSFEKRPSHQSDALLRLSFSQKVEITTDYFGRDILKEAKFNPAALYDALEILQDVKIEDGKTTASKTFSGFISSHPEDRFRQAANRAHLTFDRYEKGWPTPVPLKAKITAADLKPLNRAGTFDRTEAEVFTTIQGGMDHLESLLQIWKTNPSYRTLENLKTFNIAITRLDQHFLKDPALKLSVSSVKQFARIQAALVSGDGSYLKDAEFPKLIDVLEVGSKRYPIASRRRTLLEIHPFFRSDEYLEAFISEWTKNDRALESYYRNDFKASKYINRYFENVSASIPKIQTVLPSGQVARALGAVPEFFNILREYPIIESGNGNTISPKILHDLFLTPLHERDRVFFLSEILKNDGYKGKKLSYLFGFLKSGTPTSLWAVLEEESRNKIVLNGKQLEERRQLLRLLWKDKELFAACELFLNDGRRFDWYSVFQAVGVSPEEGTRQIQNALKKTLSSQDGEEWAFFFRNIPTERDSKNIPLRLSRASGSKRVKAPIWMSEELAPYLRGEFLHDAQKIDRSALTRILGTRALSLKPNAFRIKFQEIFGFYAKTLDEKKTTPEAIQKIVLATLGTLIEHSETGKNHVARGAEAWAFENIIPNLPPIDDLIADWILGSKLSPEKQKEVMDKIWGFSGNPVDRGWGSTGSWKGDLFQVSSPLSFYHKLRKAGVGGPGWKFYLPANANGRRIFLSQKENLQVVNTLLDEINGEMKIDLKKGSAHLSELLGALWSEAKLTIIRIEEWDATKKKMIGMIEGIGMPNESAIPLLARLSWDGTMPEIDKALLRRVPTLSPEDFFLFADESATPYMGNNGYRSNMKGRFHSNQNQMEWMKKFVSVKTRNLPIEVRSIDPLLGEVARIAPNASLARDKVLEEIAWKAPEVRSSGLELLESMKTYSRASKVDQNLVRVSSAVSTYIQSLAPAEIRQLISHLRLNPGAALNPELRKRLKNSLVGNVKLQERLLSILSEVYEWWKREQAGGANEVAELTLDWIDHFLSGMTGPERIPLIDLLMHSGKPSMIEGIEWELNFARDFLGYTRGSKDEKVLRAFLNASPAHERSVALAYLASLDPSEKVGSSLGPIFEVFKTPGKKAAQFADTFKLLGERSSELHHFKSSKEMAMPKARFLEIVEGELGSKFDGTRLEKVISSASMKTVAEAIDPDSNLHAFAVIDPYAQDQSISHLDFGKRFLANLDKEGLTAESNLMTNLISSLERQLVIESDSKNEVEMMTAARESTERLLASRGGDYEGWKIEIPKISTRYGTTAHVIPMSVAEGEFFTALKGSEKESGGRALATYLVDLLFKEGIWDADRHWGQQLFKVGQSPVVTVLDWGQGERFSRKLRWIPDDRTKIAEFLYSLSLRDGYYTATVIGKMSKKGSVTSAKIQELGRNIDALYLQKFSQEDEAIELFKLSQRAGFAIEDRFGVGFLKGLLILGGEKYADPIFMRDLIADAVSTHLKSKGLFGLISRYESLRLSKPGLGAYRCLKLLLSEF